MTRDELDAEIDRLVASGETLYTLAKSKPFTVAAGPKGGRYFIPSQGKRQKQSAICPAYLEQIAAIFNKSGGSLDRRLYKPPTSYGSYYCAVMAQMPKG